MNLAEREVTPSVCLVNVIQDWIKGSLRVREREAAPVQSL